MEGSFPCYDEEEITIPALPSGDGLLGSYSGPEVPIGEPIRTHQPMNEAEHLAQSTLMAMMGRTAAYTGKEVTWEEMMDSNERLGPTEYAMGTVDIKADVPVPGTAENVAKHART